jgi:proteic killer suppression protein
VFDKYRNRDTARQAAGEFVPKFQSVSSLQIEVRLGYLESATSLNDLRQIPSNRLEALKGDRQGQYSIRINNRWRICFEWSDEYSEAFNIEIVDYH